MRLTEKTTQALNLDPGQDDKIWFDDQITGFGFRVRRVKKWSGARSNKPPSRSWLFQYRIAGKTRRLNIGQSAAIKAARAREIAAELFAKTKLGRDPAIEKRVSIERAGHTSPKGIWPINAASCAPAAFATSRGTLKTTRRHLTPCPSTSLIVRP